jgi:hypothetical protein
MKSAELSPARLAAPMFVTLVDLGRRGGIEVEEGRLSSIGLPLGGFRPKRRSIMADGPERWERDFVGIGLGMGNGNRVWGDGKSL